MRITHAFAALLLLASTMPVGAAPSNGPAEAVVPETKVGQPPCTFCFAVVNSNGTLARGRGVKSVSRLGTGTYQVLFNFDVDQCGFQFTVALPSFSGSLPGSTITGAGRVGTVNGIFVQTFNQGGTLTDLPFHALITC